MPVLYCSRVDQRLQSIYNYVLSGCLHQGHSSFVYLQRFSALSRTVSNIVHHHICSC
ncbi:unnamed protein product [Callosobruchus maculatus]|uniref:Uncharacterized protein n=1 Tax=Callosobruchus maculatus TaxID=64391 RepID=A0A653C9E4_CALMS|nr:unnamed protein product [Callosobruchus maculatus]